VRILIWILSPVVIVWTAYHGERPQGFEPTAEQAR